MHTNHHRAATAAATAKATKPGKGKTRRTVEPTLDQRAVDAFLAQQADRGRVMAVRSVIGFDLGWIIEFDRADGTPADLRAVVDLKQRVAVFGTTVDASTTIAQFCSRSRRR